MSNIIYHITTADAWQQAVASGAHEDASLATEGFIHCSKAHQVAGVLERYFAGQSGLMKLTIDASRLNAALQYDYVQSVNEEFPHIYGKINLDAVISAETI